MSELTVAARYAKSLIDLAQEQNQVEVLKADMELFHHTLRANPELKAVLANPIVSHQKKIKILDEVFAGKVNGISISFFKLMINKGRGEVLYTTAQEYVNMYDVKNHIIHASVVSATPLSKENKDKIVADIIAATGGTVKLDAKVDASLIGGFVLTVGDRQVDTSIANEVSAILRQQLAGFKSESELEEVGTVLQVGDGIARVYGLTKVQSGELVEFGTGLQGIVLNLEEDNDRLY
eukprot:gene16035-16204_t